MVKIVLLGFVLLFLGCSATQDIRSLFKKDRFYAEALRNSKKGDILLSLEDRAQIIATYLNNFQKNKDETFFVRVYIDNDFEDENKSGLFHPGFSLRLNSKEPVSIKIVDKDSIYVKNMPFNQPWYHYYIVKFKKQNTKNLKLEFKNKDIRAAILEFEKNHLD